MARVKNSHCLKFSAQVDPSKTRKVKYFFSLNVFLFQRKTNFSLSPSRIDGSGHNRSKIEHFHSLRISKMLRLGKSYQRELFHRLFVVCKCKFCRNWLLRRFQPCEKTMCSLPLQKSVGEENLLFHHVPLFRIPPNYVCKFPKKLFKIAHGRHKITQYVDCVTKELRSIPAFEITQNRTGEPFQKQITN